VKSLSVGDSLTAPTDNVLQGREGMSVTNRNSECVLS